MLNIVQAHLHSKYNLAVTFTLTPALLKAEKRQIFQRLEAATSELDFFFKKVIIG